jgi:hypothetical protein
MYSKMLPDLEKEAEKKWLSENKSEDFEEQ